MNSAPGPYHFPADSSKTFKFDFFNLVGAGRGGSTATEMGMDLFQKAVQAIILKIPI